MNNFGHAIAVWSLLDHEDLQVSISFGESSCNNTSGEAT
jgi:hypothetical protein